MNASVKRANRESAACRDFFGDKKSQGHLPRAAADCAVVLLRRPFAARARIRDALARSASLINRELWLLDRLGQRLTIKSFEGKR